MRVELSTAAVADLQKLIRTHSLPADTPARLARSLEVLDDFPRIGIELSGRWDGLRAVVGPWRWMIAVYRISDAEKRVVVVTIEDGRSALVAGALPPESSS